MSKRGEMGMNIFKRMAVTFVSLLIAVLVLGAGTIVFAEETKPEEVKVVAEKENNNKKSKANKIELGGAITGKLSSEKDADWYKFSSLGEGKIQFNFTHEASGAYAYYWYATVYDTDGKKSFKRGHTKWLNIQWNFVKSFQLLVKKKLKVGFQTMNLVTT